MTELERWSSGGPGTAYVTAAIMWVLLAGLGLDLPRWGVAPASAAYVALLSVLAVIHSRRIRMRLHRSRSNWRMLATLVAGAVVTGGTALVSGPLVESLEPMAAGPVPATVTSAAFLLFVGPAGKQPTREQPGEGRADEHSHRLRRTDPSLHPAVGGRAARRHRMGRLRFHP
ncbi:hypothetical protein OHA98_22735 [Streptomyces sp. NBC_00654]|uniref:hypothetical protein n=1 Tax=Streptomyces sp. NBC_00654 TaxID=2975799 RepID=UPI00224DA254|nr:hypothetical protein [Streptomyces sp. NBC_00654]MCX4967524.1 hypothetical protein [Streptomyces sp. NBC_00654]